ncbi:MAG: pilus assembly protein [Gemmobacter sp.]|nr:pilus assembly protein [Gemmobacter sp.]
MKALRALTRMLRCQQGTAAIEFAFVVGPLMLLIFGSIEVSRLVWVRNALHESAISGARCMGIRAADCVASDSVNPEKTKTYIRNVARSWGLSVAATGIDLDVMSGCDEPAGFSGVVINYQFKSVLTLLTGPWLTFEACFPNQD